MPRRKLKEVVVATVAVAAAIPVVVAVVAVVSVAVVAAFVLPQCRRAELIMTVPSVPCEQAERTHVQRRDRVTQ